MSAFDGEDVESPRAPIADAVTDQWSTERRIPLFVLEPAE
jgi:hypothetical protein